MTIAALVQGPRPLAIYSDASESWGCAAWSNTAWFQLPWDAHTHDFQIAVKELIPIIIAAAVWDGAWKGKVFCCRCYNQAVEEALSTTSSREGHLMYMLRCLVLYIKTHYRFQLSAVYMYISTLNNHVADDLLRNRVASFLAKLHGVDQGQHPFPYCFPNSYSIHSWTGYHKPGQGSLAMLSVRTGPVNTTNKPSSHDTL